jgi:hypothetical protein
MPSRTVTDCGLTGGGPAAHHVDRRLGQRADQGDGAGFFSGRVWLRFSSSTRLRRATSRAAARCRRLSA